MPIKRNFKIKSVTIILSVAIFILVFGVLLEDQVIPEPKKPLLTEQTAAKAKAKAKEKAEAKAAEKIKTAQEVAAEKRKKQTAKIEQLDQKASTTIQKADALVVKADQLIADAGLPKPEGNKSISLGNQSITKRLAKARSKLDSLKQ